MDEGETNVFDITTGEPLDGIYTPRQNHEACVIIEALYQRRHQVQDMAVVWVENDPLQSIKHAETRMSEIELMGLVEFLRDVVKYMPAYVMEIETDTDGDE